MLVTLVRVEMSDKQVYIEHRNISIKGCGLNPDFTDPEGFKHAPPVYECEFLTDAVT